MNEITNDKILELANSLKGKDMDQISLFKRKRAKGYWWYIKDYNGDKPKVHAIGTQDQQIARRVYTELTSKIAYGQSELGAIIQLNVAKLDRDMQLRTWSDVYNHYISQGQRASTLATYCSAWKHELFDSIKNVKVVETTKAQITDIYRAACHNNQQHLRSLYNHAKRQGWLVNQNLVAPDEWSAMYKTVGGTTASITEEIHLAVLAAMEKDLANWDTMNRRMRKRCIVLTQEVKSLLEVLWELGASNADARELTCDNINWNSGHVVYKRKKWKGMGKGNKRTREAIHFPMSQKLKDVIRPWYNESKKQGGGYLFPTVARTQSCNVTRVFHDYMKVAGMPLRVKCEDGQERRIILHSYRYRMAEHLYEIGYTEKQAKTLLGHNSTEVNLAYSKGAKMSIPAPDVMAERNGHTKVIQMHKVA